MVEVAIPQWPSMNLFASFGVVPHRQDLFKGGNSNAYKDDTMHYGRLVDSLLLDLQ